MLYSSITSSTAETPHNHDGQIQKCFFLNCNSSMKMTELQQLGTGLRRTAGNTTFTL